MAGCWPWASNRGAVLWDLARGTELAFLPIGNAWHLMFEPSGDLITSGDIGVQRWPVHLDRERGEFQIGPPRPLRLPAGLGRLPRTDRAGSWPRLTRTMLTSRPLSGRSVWGRWTIAAASPSVRTGNGWRPAVRVGGAQVWRIAGFHEGGRAAHRWGHGR